MVESTAGSSEAASRQRLHALVGRRQPFRQLGGALHHAGEGAARQARLDARLAQQARRRLAGGDGVEQPVGPLTAAEKVVGDQTGGGPSRT